MDELEVILSCASTVLTIFSEPSPVIGYLQQTYEKQHHDLALSLIDEYDSEAEYKPPAKIKKNVNVFEDLDCGYPDGDADFQVYFKMSRSTVQEIIDLIERAHLKPVQRGRPIMPIRKLVLLSIWLLTNKEGFRGVAERFGIGKGHAHRAFEIFCVTLHAISHEFIKWPNMDEVDDIFNGYRKLSGLPKVIGTVGIIHVSIPKPAVHDELFQNSYGYHSVILQAVCNHQHEFTNVLAGPTGANSELEVWNASPIYEKIIEFPEEILPHYSYILTNSAYRLSGCLLPPYNNNHQLSSMQETFNTCHSLAYSTIRETFNKLLSRFQRLTYLNMTRLDLLPKVIVAACVLHNLCISKNEIDVPEEQTNISGKFYDTNHFGDSNEIDECTTRDEIANYLMTHSVILSS